MDFLVDVNIASYNHERFIGKAIKNVLNQITDFRFRVLIGDDASTDRSPQIIKAFECRHPNKIEAFYHNINRGINTNLETNGLFLLRQSTAKYIALLDGDDYWTDPLKLQKQVDFLEANPEYSLCFHDVEKLYDDGRKQLFQNKAQIPFDTEYLIRNGRPCHTCSILFRREALDLGFLNGRSRFLSGDLAILLNLSLSGNFKNIPEVMAVYRVHDKGISKDTAWRKKLLDSNIDLLNFFNQRSNFKYNTLIRNRIGELRLMQIRGAEKLTDKIDRIKLLQQDKPDFLLIHLDKIIISFFWWFIHKTRLYYLKRWAKRLIGAKKMV